MRDRQKDLDRERNDIENCAKIVPLPSLALNFAALDATPFLLLLSFSIDVVFYYSCGLFFKRRSL